MNMLHVLLRVTFYFHLENRGGTTMHQITQKLKLKKILIIFNLSLPVNTL